MAWLTGHGVRAVTVPPVTAPASVVVHTAPCRLCGWSLTSSAPAGTSLEASGTQTAPAAGTTITSVIVPAGTWTVTWSVGLRGTPGAGEVNNFQLTAGTITETSQNQGTVGEQGQLTVTVTLNALSTLLIKNIGIGTAGAIYDAELVVTPVIQPATAQINDAGQPMGTVGVLSGLANTQMLGEHGVFVGSQLSVQALTGTISGVLYVTDFDYNTPSRP
jgi:hypothetical protein